jgi:hypothetical protein
MDPRHPTVAFAANTSALVLGVGLIFSAFLPIGTPTGWKLVETILAILVAVSLAVSWWAKKEHVVPVVHAHGSSSEQYEAMEDLPTMVNLDSNHESVNPNTAAVIASIIGGTSTQEETAVANAIDTLSSGEIGASAAAAVAHNEVDHTKVNIDTFDVRGFQTQGVDTVPLPSVAELELPELPSPVDLPEMPDLEDLLTEDAIANVPPPLDLPELPDF